MVSDLTTNGVSTVTEHCLEAFYPFVSLSTLHLTLQLAEKKVISVEMMEQSLQQQLSGQKQVNESKRSRSALIKKRQLNS